MKKLYTQLGLAIATLVMLFGGGNLAAQDTLQYGNGTINNTGTTYPAPYGNWFYGARHQFLIPASELNGQQLLVDSITGLAFDVVTPEGTDLINFTISMGHTTANTLTAFQTGLQQVYLNPLQSDTVTGWVWHDFDSTFHYNGADNLIIEICFDNSSTSTFTNNAIFNLSNYPYTASITQRQDGGFTCSDNTLDVSSSNRPNMLFKLFGQPITDDVLVSEIIAPVSGCGLDTAETVAAYIVNNANQSVSNFPVSFQVDANTPVTETVTATINAGDTLLYTFSGTANLGAFTTYNVVVYTALGTDMITANDTMSVTVTNQQPLTLPYFEDFDTQLPIQLTQSADDDFDWTLDANGTGSGGTGPDFDHTLGAGNGGNYYYIETSVPINTGDVAILESPCIELAGAANPYLEFYYHMLGAAMGSLSVEISADGGQTWTEVWTESGNQGNQWLHGKIDLTVEGYAGQIIQYRFVGIDGTSFTGDAAIDDILVYDKPDIHDLFVDVVYSPSAGPRCDPTPLDTVSISIGNCGTFNESSFSVAYSINGGTPVVEPVIGTVQPTQTIDFTFATLADMTMIGSYDLEVWTVLGTDTITYNDTMLVSLSTDTMPIPMLGPDTAICMGEAALLNPGSFSSYSWSTGASSTTLSPTAAGAYTVTVTDGNGCTGSDVINVIVNSLPSISLGNDTSICATDSLVLDAGMWSTYMWNTGDSTQTATVDSSTSLPCSYQFDMFDSFGDGWNGASAEIYINGNLEHTYTITGGTFGSEEFSIFHGDSLQMVFTSGGFPGEESFTLYDGTGAVAYADGPTPANGLVLDTVAVCGASNVITVDLAITDANGCFAYDTIDVIIVDTLTLDLGPDLFLCDGESVTLDAGLIGASYAWSTGDSTQTITIDSSGTYYLDLVKCSAVSDTINVTFLPLPSVSLPADTSICVTDTLVVDAGSGPWSYMWNSNDPADTNQTITISADCEYTLDMFDSFGDGWNGHNMDVYIDGQLQGNYTLPGGSFGQAFIPVTHGQGIEIVFNSGGFPGETSYELYNGAGQLVHSNGPSPSYGTVYTASADCFGGNGAAAPVIVSVTDTATGCVGTDTMMVTFIVPNPDLGPDTNLCAGQSLTLDPGAFSTVTWYNSTMTPTIDVFGSGNYWVDVVDSVGCIGNDSITVIFNANPTPNAADVNACDGDMVTLNPGAYVTYMWNTGDTTQTIMPDSSATYFVTVVDVNNCSGTDSAVVVFNANPVVDLGSDTSICGIDSLLLDAAVGTMWAWNTGDTTQSITVDTTNTYSVTATDANGCVGSDDRYVFVIDVLTFDLGPDTAICDGDTLTLDPGIPGATYSWSTGATTQTIQVDNFGSYILDLTQCGTLSDTLNLIIYPKPIITVTNDGGTFCAYDSIALIANGANTYDWFDGDTAYITTADTLSGMIGNQPFWLQVYGTDTNGCVGTDSVGINLFPQYDPALGNDTIICDGTTLTLDAGSDAAITGYMWNDGSTMQTLDVDSAGTYWVAVTDTNGCTHGDTISILTIAPPSIDLGPDTSVCTNESIVLATGGGMAAYNWSTGDSTSSITVNMGGTYEVTVTSFFGCFDADTVVVAGLTPPSVDLGPDSTLCPGDSVILDGGAGLSTYAWSTGDTTQMVVADTTFNYAVTITAANGCMDSDSRMLTLVTGAPPVDLGMDQDICVGDSVMFDAGFPGATYAWGSGETSQTVWVSTAGMVTVDVTICGQTGSDTAMVNVNPLPNIDLGPDTFYCVGDGNAFSVTLDAGNGFLYNWSNGSSGQSVTVDTAGTTWVTITNINGCSNSDTINVQEFTHPTVDLGLDEILCVGESVTFDAGAGATYTYNWSNGDTTQTVVVDSATAVYVTISSGLCGTASDTVEVSVDPGPSITLGNDTTLCGVSEFTITPGAGYAGYMWGDSTTADTLNVTMSGTYMVTVTNVNGCTDDALVSVTLAVNPTVDLGADLEFCDGDSDVLDAGAGFAQYDWSTTATTQTITVTTTGSYSVTVTNSDGCVGSDTADVTVNANPTVDLGPDTVIVEFTTLDLDAGAGFAQYDWSTAETTQIITVDGDMPATDYCVTVTDGNGCTGTDCINVDTMWNAINTVAAQRMAVNYAPNPSRGNVTMTIKDAPAGAYVMTILSVDGKLVSSEQLNIGSSVFVRQLSLNDLAKGVYYIKLESDQVTKMDKIVIH